MSLKAILLAGLAVAAIPIAVPYRTRAEATAWAQGKSQDKRAAELRLGSVQDRATKELGGWPPFAEYLGRAMGSVGIEKCKIVVTRTMREMSERMARGEVDVLIAGSFPTAVIAKSPVARPILRRWKSGKATYSGVIFARADSKIDRIEQLAGKKIALQTAASTSGTLLARDVLKKTGIELHHCARVGDAPVPGRFNWVYSMGDENTVQWVLRGLVAAGASNDDTLRAIAGVHMKELKIIGRSIEVPRHVVSVRSDLPIDVLVRLREVLLGMHEHDEGKKALAAFEGTTKFDEFSIDPIEVLRPIAELAAELAKEEEAK